MHIRGDPLLKRFAVSIRILFIVTFALLSVEVDCKSADLSSSKRNLIRYLFSVDGTEAALTTTYCLMFEQVQHSNPTISEQDVELLKAEMSFEELLDIYVMLYDKHFTYEDIEELIKLYETSLGKKMAKNLPLVSGEGMKIGYEWGKHKISRFQEKLQAQAKLDARNERGIKTKDGAESGLTGNISKGISEKKKGITEEQKRKYLELEGYDPEKYELQSLGGGQFTIVAKPKVQPPPLKPKEIIAPAGTKYIIIYKDMHLFSKEEPKVFGSGYKFTPAGTDVEMIISGDVQIIKCD